MISSISDLFAVLERKKEIYRVYQKKYFHKSVPKNENILKKMAKLEKQITEIATMLDREIEKHFPHI